MAPLHQLDGRLALAHAALPGDEDALAVDLQHGAVAGDPRTQIDIQGGDQLRLENGGVQLRGQQAHLVFLRHFQAFRVDLHAVADDEGGDMPLHQLREDLAPLRGGQSLQVHDLHRAHELDALVVKMAEKPYQLHAGPVQIRRDDADAFKIGRRIDLFQAEFLHQLGQLDAVSRFHGSFSSCPVETILHYYKFDPSGAVFASENLTKF